MKPPRLSLAISSTPSITPVPAVIRTRKTSITTRIAIEFQVCCSMVNMMQLNTMSIKAPRMKGQLLMAEATSLQLSGTVGIAAFIRQ